jgi:hypothetical protein
MTKVIGDFLAGALVVGGLLVMVRPRSQGPALVSAVTNGTQSILSTVTGGGSF